MNVKQIIGSAYRFEIANIESNSTTRNPHYDTIMQIENGKILWETVNLMVESYTNHRKQYEELEQFANRLYGAYDNLTQVIERQAEEIADLKQRLFDGKNNSMDDLPF